MPKWNLVLLYLLSSFTRRRQLSLIGGFFSALVIFTCLSIKSAVYYYPQIPFQDIRHVLVVSDHDQQSVCLHKLEQERDAAVLDVRLNVTKASLQHLGQRLQPGGYWKPESCSSKYRVNVLVPYRKRQWQLEVFLNHIHSLLQRQEVEYLIAVIEQTDRREFNRGKLFNIGFAEMQKTKPADCYVFHDVDLMPLSANHIYACTEQPRHMSSAVDVFRFNLPYTELFGGAVALTVDQFSKVNGYSNSFYGWGGEDDDFFSRVSQNGYSILRFEPSISRYKMLNHVKEKPNPDRFNTLSSGRSRFDTDGLNNLQYQVLQFELLPLYTWILVDV